MPKARQALVELAGREVVITNPDKLFFPQAGYTKLHLVRYYAAVARGARRERLSCATRRSFCGW
jgi:bifunctional non-homologous end joining protein LigD